MPPSYEEKRLELVSKCLVRLGAASEETIRRARTLALERKAASGQDAPLEEILAETGGVTAGGLMKVEEFLRTRIRLCRRCAEVGRPDGNECSGCGGPLGDQDAVALRLDTSRTFAYATPLDPAPPPPPPPAATPQARERFGPYTLIERLGVGGMGVVWRAEDPALGREVALKMLLSGRGASAVEIERFDREARATARFNHPNIVSVHHVGVHDGNHYFTMDLVRGSTLADRLKKSGPLEPAEAVRLLGQVAAGVHYAHQRAIIHRDLNPKNILLTEDGVPRITDFGIARDMENESRITRAGLPVGTPAYMSPEQAAGALEQIDVRSDVYSLGTILYELVTGNAPFLDRKPQTLLELVNLVANFDPTPPRRLRAGLPRDLETICLKCLAKDPERRYQSAADLGADLAAWVRGEPISARPYSILERSAMWARRHRPVVAVAVVVLVAAGIVGGVLLELRREKRRRIEELAALAAEHEAAGRMREARDAWVQILGMAPEHLEANRGVVALQSRLEEELRRAEARRRTAENRERAAPLLAEANAAYDTAHRIESEAGGLRASLERAILGFEHAEALRLQTALDERLASLEPWHSRALEAYSRVLTLVPEDSFARGRRLDVLFRLYLAAERQGRDLMLHTLRQLIRTEEGGNGTYETLLDPTGKVRIATDPAGARCRLARVGSSADHVRREPAEWVDLGPSPISERVLPRGSWLLEVEDDGPDRVVRAPFFLERDEEVRLEVRVPPPGEGPSGMAFVPDGVFLAGGDPIALQALSPRRVRLRDFWIDEREVTVAEYARFLADLGAEAKKHVPKMIDRQGRPVFGTLGTRVEVLEVADHDPSWPVAGIRSESAVRYALWRSVREGRTFRLPDELEWEKAARGADGRSYPWGDGFEARFANVVGVDIPDQPAMLSPVGSHPDDRSVYGAFDMAGNVAEWTSSSPGGIFRVVKGASFLHRGDVGARCASRNYLDVSIAAEELGFRLVLEPAREGGSRR